MRTGDTPARRAAAVRPHAARRPDHHARVAVPAAHLGRPRVAARRAHGHRRRGARGGGHQARRAPGAVAGAARRPARRRPAQRIGLSATVRPLDEVATFLAGARPVEIVQPPAAKTIEVRVEVPVPDLTALDERPAPAASDEEVVGSAAGRRSGRRSGRPWSGGCWTWSGSTAPRSCSPTRGGSPSGSRPGSTSSRPRRPDEAVELDAFPAEAIGQSGIGGGAPPVVAKAHHGSMSREQRTVVEEELKAGLLPCVVATSSLELGIDMGAVDLVVQVEAPPSVASGLQRVGRAGHQVGRRLPRRGLPQVPRRPRLVRGGRRADDGGGDRVAALPAQPARRAGPADRGDGGAGAVDARRPRRGGAPGRAVRRAAGLGAARRAGHAGRALPHRRSSASSGARITWDRVTDELRGRPGAQRLAVTSGGTIPDRGLFTVTTPGGADGAGRGSASSTRRWSTSRGSATRSCSARRAGGSRTSPTTG